MKTRLFFLSMALASVMVSCTDGLSDKLQWDEGVMATLPEYEDVAGTRVAFNNSLTSFTWSNGDCIGVCRSSVLANGTAAFTLLKGGATVGNFINDSFSLNPQADYYAFYPFAVGTTATSFPIDITGQVQTANNSTEHIGKFNYMSTIFTTDDNGKASFTFSNICTVIQIHFTAEDEVIYKSLSISSNGTPFATKASYNLKDNTITPTESKSVFQLSFGEGLHVYKDEAVTISAIIVPRDMSESTLTFAFKDAGGVQKEFSMAGYAFSPGKLYHFYADVSKGEPPYGGCPDGKHPHAIDLGLPSGTLWSCMELGAESPFERGFKYSWGQTAFAQKSYSNWSNYEFMDESLGNEWGIWKYQVADNNTDGIWYSADGAFIGDNNKTLDLADDAAWQNWGGAWRMPTKEEVQELILYTENSQYEYSSEYGYRKVVYKKKANGKYSLWDPHIFYLHNGYGSEYYTWTSSLSGDTRMAIGFGWYQLPDGLTFNNGSRTQLRYIRPVQSPSTGDSGSQSGGRP